MAKLKTVHIHTDIKFISASEDFTGPCFENIKVIISNDPVSNRASEKGDFLFNYSMKSALAIVKLCQDADLVVMYDLNFIKSVIALNLSPDITIAWRFFGYELYKQAPEKYISQLTKEALSLSILQKGKELVNQWIISAKMLLKWGPFTGKVFKRAMQRMDIFLCFSKEEYDHLKTCWPALPPSINLPFDPTSGCLPDRRGKQQLVIIGNNRSIYNNNLDVIQIIKRSDYKNNYKFVILFNYGDISNYSKKVLQEVNEVPCFRVIEDFMPLEEFRGLYSRASAAVFNGFRQMAMGNIYEAIQHGVKIYLNTRNPVMHWLRREGLIIHSTDDFEKDIDKGNLSLSAVEAKHNAEQWMKLEKVHTLEKFQHQIFTFINDKQARAL
jgi:hypothetical protein